MTNKRSPGGSVLRHVLVCFWCKHNTLACNSHSHILHRTFPRILCRTSLIVSAWNSGEMYMGSSCSTGAASHCRAVSARANTCRADRRDGARPCMMATRVSAAAAPSSVAPVATAGPFEGPASSLMRGLGSPSAELARGRFCGRGVSFWAACRPVRKQSPVMATSLTVLIRDAPPGMQMSAGHVWPVAISYASIYAYGGRGVGGLRSWFLNAVNIQACMSGHQARLFEAKCGINCIRCTV